MYSETDTKKFTGEEKLIHHDPYRQGELLFTIDMK